MAPGYISTGLMPPAPLVKLPAQLNQVQTQAQTVVWFALHGVTSELMKPRLTTSTVAAEAKTLNGQLKANIEPLIPGISCSQDSLVVELNGAMEDTEAEPSNKPASTVVELRTAHVEAVKSDTNLPKTNLPENAETIKAR